ncbi:MAG: OmpA family protein [Dokdonella sp.]
MTVLIKCCSVALLLCMATWCYADSEDGKDCDGCSDSGLLARYPGSVLFGADLKAFDEAVFPTGPATKSEDGATVAPKTLTATGKRIRAFYFAPAQRSGLEVFTNYREALEKSGLSVVWACSGDEQCGPEFLGHAMEVMHIHLTNTPEADLGFTLAETPRYLLAKQDRPQGNLQIGVIVADIPDKQRAGVYVIQVENKPMDKGMAATKQSEPVVENKPVVVESTPVGVESKPVDSTTLGNNLASAGQVNVYGIHFDFDKADIKPQSKAQLDEIAKLLTTNPALRLRVTGHTDNIGTAEHNQVLSKLRADAIVAVLVANYGIAADRLASAGLGASLPVTSNDSEEGRASNRRVELVKQ